MKPKTSNWADALDGKILKQAEILRQITEHLESIHSQGNVHGGLTPSHVNPDENPIIKPNDSLAGESLSEWRPAEETNLAKNLNAESKPTEEGDIFNLGCFFYYTITRGQHPFGGSGHRVSFIANNLYDLSGCRDKQLQKLIAKMISHDSTQRPTCSELLRHPYLWKSEEIQTNLYRIADNMDESSNQYLKFKDHFLLSSSQPSSVKSVADILADIKRRQEAPLNVCNSFPDFMSSIFFTDNPESEIQKEINDEFCPITFQNLLIAKTSFGELGPFKKRNGRFGLQPVHVMEFSQKSTDVSEESLFLMKRLACLSHPNMLKYFYVGENLADNSSERLIVLACEPFNETLETLAKSENSLDFERANDILTQTTAGLLDYHSNNLVHGNITSSQIAIFKNSEKIIAKISKFPFISDDEERTGQPSMENDVRRLGQTFLDLFKQVKDVPPLCHHLIQSMQDSRDECVPPCEALFYHPFFWSSGEVAEFLLAAGDFYKDNPSIDRNTTLKSKQNSVKEEYQHLKKNRSAIEYFLSHTTVCDSATEENAEGLAADLTKEFPMLVIETWLTLQKFKSTDSGLDLDPFYCPTYNFPTYKELREGAVDSKTEQKGTKPIENICQEIVTRNALPIDDKDEGYDSEPMFEIGEFSISSPPEHQFKSVSRTEPTPVQVSSNPVELIPSWGEDHPIQLYLNYYLHKWDLAEKDNSPGIIMKHPIIDPFGRTAMHLACHSDNFYESAEKLLDLGSDPNVEDKNGYVPLHVAAETKAIRIAELLIAKKAKIDISAKDSNTPLFFATISNSPPIVRILIKHKADVTKLDHLGRSPLHFAVATNSPQNVDLLLKPLKSHPDSLCEIVNAVDQDGMSALHIAVANHSIGMVEYLLKEFKANPNVGQLNGKESMQQAEKKRPVLQLAVNLQLCNIIGLLLQAGADPDCTDFHGQTSLHVAALLPPDPNRLKIVDRLITNKEKRANVNAVDKMGRTALHVATFNKAEDVVQRLLERQPHIEVDKREKERGITALHLAAWKNLKKIADLLVNKGNATPDAKDVNGDTPLEYAASSNAIDVAEELLKANDGLAKTKRWSGRSPLHVAAAHGAIEVGGLLILKGADINARDNLDLTPLHYAEFRGHDTFVELLRKNGNRMYTADPPVTSPLTPTELKSVHNLTNSFRSNSVPEIQIRLPTFVAQFNDFRLNVTQELIIKGFRNN